MVYDAVGIEHAFSMLVGEGRGALGGLVEADVFRNGNPESIGQLLQRTADVLEERITAIEFEPWELVSAKPKARLEVAVEGLRRIGRDMENMSNREPEDYHWIVVKHLIQIIASLLDHMEGKTRW